MRTLTILLILAILLLSGIRLRQAVRYDVFSPLVFWYALLILLLYSRLLVILTVDLDYRWVGDALPNELERAAVKLVALSVLATLSLEFGVHYGKRQIPRCGSPLSFSVSLSLIPLIVGAAGFMTYFYLLGGIPNIVDNLSASKSVPGGGVVLLLGSVIWAAPIMAVSNCSEPDRKIRIFLSGIFFAFALLLVAVYGRATPIIWGTLLYVFALQYCGPGLRIGRLVFFSIVVLIAFIAFKAFRLSVSWDIDLSTVWELLELYGDFMLSSGGEQSITDMSIRLLMWGDSDFPLGSFWDRWISWPTDLLPSALFPFELETSTVGRQMYWWASGRYDIDTGVPVFGFVSAYKTGSLGLVILVYACLGYLAARLHSRLFQKRASDTLAYLMALCLLLFFSRIGDFSAALVQVVVLGAAPWLLLKCLNAFFGHQDPESRGKYPLPI